MLATVDSCLLAGMEGRLVEVQADAANGDSHFYLVGLASASVKEARDRVRSAIRNSGMPFPQRRLTVNLAPPEMRKDGSVLDLPIAVAILLAHQGLKPPPRSAFLGELALDGTVRPARRGQDDACAQPARHPAAAGPWRSPGGGAGAEPAGRAAAGQAGRLGEAVSRSAPRHLHGGSHRRRLGPRESWRDFAGASRGVVPRRAGGVPGDGCAGTAAAAGGRS